MSILSLFLSTGSWVTADSGLFRPNHHAKSFDAERIEELSGFFDKARILSLRTEFPTKFISPAVIFESQLQPKRARGMKTAPGPLITALAFSFHEFVCLSFVIVCSGKNLD